MSLVVPNETHLFSSVVELLPLGRRDQGIGNTAKTLSNMDNQSGTVLVLLDLSAAFDTIDHSVLFERLENIIGVTGIAHNWFKSYLDERSQQIQIGDVISLVSVLLFFGVPQGSVLGPLLFLIYTLP